MTYRPLTDIPISLLTNSSTMASGYVLRAYLTGTTTPATLYSDANGTTAGTSITLDARGEPTTIKRIWLDTAVTYKLVLETDGGSVVWTADPVYGSYNPASTSVNVLDYGAVGDGVTDDTAAIQAAIDAVQATGGGALHVPAGTHIISSMLTVADANPIVFFGDGYSSKIQKAFNGDMVSLGARSTMRDIYLEGDYANYTGRGVVVTSGSLGVNSWRQFSRVYILGTESYGIEFTGASYGYGTRIADSFIVPGNMNTPSTVAAVKFPTETSNGNRSMINVWCFGQPIADCSGTDNATIIGCTGNYPLLSSTSKKIIIQGNRIVASATAGQSWTIDGTDCNIVGNAIAPMTITFAATCAKLVFKNSYGSGTTIVDNSNGFTDGNDIWIQSTNYTPTWAGGSPAIGNGTLTGNVTRSGQYVEINIRMTAGSTTTFGSGAWTFSLPYTALRSSSGSAWIKDDSANAYYVGTAFVTAGENVVRVITASSTSTWVGSAHPVAWATSDELRIDIRYII